MSDNDAGQGEANPTGTDDGRIKALEATISERDVTINRLRGTQGSNDRTIGELKEQVSGLEANVGDLTSQTQALTTDLTTANALSTDLNKQLTDLGDVSEQLSSSRQEFARLQIAAAKAGESPVIASLIANNSLPSAEDNDAFIAALDSISGSVQTIATNAATSMLSGAKPPTSPGESGATKTPDALRAEAQKHMAKKEVTEALALMQQADALEASART